jgi:hypothetical protein
VLWGGLPDVATLILFLAAWGMARKSSASSEGNVVGIEHGLARVIGVREKLAEGYESRHLHVAPHWRCTRSRDRVSPKHGNACRALVRRPRPWSRPRLETRSLPPQTARLRHLPIRPEAVRQVLAHSDLTRGLHSVK